MLGELIDVIAAQSLIPRLRFTIRLKNERNDYWRIYAFKGNVRLHETSYTIADINGEFVVIDLRPREDHNLSFEVELDYRKLDFIEKRRKGDLRLNCYLNLLGVKMQERGTGVQPLSEAIQQGFSSDSVLVKSVNKQNA